MISKKLFRDGDLVTVRSDIVSDMDHRYSMLHEPHNSNIYVEDHYTEIDGRFQIIDLNNQYRCLGSALGLTDAMFVEGYRVMQYLCYQDEPPAEIGISYLEAVSRWGGSAGEDSCREYEHDDYFATPNWYVTNDWVSDSGWHSACRYIVNGT